MRLIRTYRFVRNVVAGAILAGCATPYSTPTSVGLAESITAQSAQSVALSEYYADLQQQMRARGLLMQGNETRAVAVTPHILARNFEAIALHDEFRPVPAGFVHQIVPNQLKRWEEPVRISVEYGSSVPVDVRRQDSQFIETYARRLSSVTDHKVDLVTSNPNFLVLIVGEDDLDMTVSRLSSFSPGILNPASHALQNMTKHRLCIVYGIPKRTDAFSYNQAIAIIRAEHPTLLRRSCIHEEVAQGLGLANDSPHARPSIFNDDEEFGFLTRHDELLLKILYDPRLSVGMTADQARPVVQSIATELAG